MKYSYDFVPCDPNFQSCSIFPDTVCYKNKCTCLPGTYREDDRCGEYHYTFLKFTPKIIVATTAYGVGSNCTSDTQCGSGSSCVAGICQCHDGYEQNTMVREEYEGILVDICTRKFMLINILRIFRLMKPLF